MPREFAALPPGGQGVSGQAAGGSNSTTSNIKNLSCAFSKRKVQIKVKIKEKEDSGQKQYAPVKRSISRPGQRGVERVKRPLQVAEMTPAPRAEGRAVMLAL